MQTVILPSALVAYVVGVFFAALYVIYRSSAARNGASVVFVLAWLAHGVGLVDRGLSKGHLAPSNLGEYLLLLGWAVMTLHLLVWFRYRVDVAGLVLPPLTACSMLGALVLMPQAVPLLERPRGWTLFHTSVSTVGMAILCLASAMSLIYLLQDRALKHHRTLRLLERLPSLDRCDQIGLQALWAGFILLTVGIGTGMLVNAMVHQRVLVAGPKQTFPVLAWLIFAIVLGARVAMGFRGRKSAYLTIAGVMLGLLTVFGMHL